MTKLFIYILLLMVASTFYIQQAVAQFDFDYPYPQYPNNNQYPNNPYPNNPYPNNPYPNNPYPNNPYPNNPYPNNNPNNQFPNTLPGPRPTQRPPPASTTRFTPASRNFLICIAACPTAPHYNPVCGSDNQSYRSREKLECARECGQPNVRVVHTGTCRIAVGGQVVT